MKSWLILLAGLLAWTAHFFAVYAIASLLPGRAEARWLVVLVTAIALAATSWLLLRALHARRSSEDEIDRWIGRGSLLGCALALVGILYQGLPAAIG